MATVHRTLFSGKPLPRPHFAAGLLEAETDRDREFRRIASFRAALAAHRREEVSFDEATAILEGIALMGRTADQIESAICHTITIGKRSYGVEPIAAGEFGSSAYRLVKDARDGAVYDVVRTHEGIVECDCPDYEARRRGTLSMCKHGQALVDAGLLDAPLWTPAMRGGA